MTDPRRLDPRVFPSETGWLLVLLAVAVLVNAWLAVILLDSMGLLGDVGPAWQSIGVFLWPGPSIYASYVWLRVQRSEPLVGTPFTAAGKVIDELASRSWTAPKPRVRLRRSAGARAYLVGLPHKPYLVLGPELLSLCSMGAPHRRIFEAVVRHELAHLQGGDLRWYQLASALRVVNVYTAAWIVFLVAFSWSSDGTLTGQLVAATLRAIGVVLLVELIARVFLRVREHYADLHAADGGIDGLLAAVSSGPESSVLRRWLRRHPGGRERSAVLQKSGVLLASGPGQLFLGATTAGVMLMTLQHGLLTGEPSNPQETPILAGVMVGLLLTLFTALTIWRSAWHAAVTGQHSRAVVFGVALFTGLVIGSHLSYSGASEFGATGIPLAPSVLLVTAVSALGLCWWLTVLGAARVRVDPAAKRLDAFLFSAGLCACVAGMWLFAMLWTWALRLLAIQLGCATERAWAVQACLSATPEIDIARSIGADFAFTPYSLLVVGVVAASLVAPRLLTRRRQAGASRMVTITAVTVLAAGVALWQVGEQTMLPSSRGEFRLVHEVLPDIIGRSAQGPQDLETARRTRQSQDPDEQQRVLTELGCLAADPLRGHADPTLPLITCSLDGTEKYLLGPVVIAGGDLEKAVADPWPGAARSTVTVMFTDAGATRLAALTTREVGQRLAILADDMVLLAPRIEAPIPDNTMMISGDWSSDEAQSLTALINGERAWHQQVVR